MCTTSAECKTVITVVLTVMSGLDPHMINLLEYDLNCGYLNLMGLCYHLIVVGIYLYLLVNRCLIKFDQLKVL